MGVRRVLVVDGFVLVEGIVVADDALLERIFRDGFRSVTPNGVLGDARGMSEEIGARCLRRSAEVIAAGLRVRG